MTKILITGANGFVGRQLVETLKKGNYLVYSMTRDNGDIRDVSSFDAFRNEGIQHIYHLAARSFVPDSWSNPSDYLDVNVNGTRNALEFARKEGASLTFMSSYLYAPEVELPTPETARLEPQNPYALSKLLGEQLCEHYARLFEMNIQVIRPFNIYGPDQPDHFIIPRLINVSKGIDTRPLGNLDVWRDFIHISDVVHILSQLIKLQGFNVLNLGSGIKTHLFWIAEYLDLNIQAPEHYRVNEIRETQADMSRLNNLLKIAAFKPFEIEL